MLKAWLYHVVKFSLLNVGSFSLARSLSSSSGPVNELKIFFSLLCTSMTTYKGENKLLWPEYAGTLAEGVSEVLEGEQFLNASRELNISEEGSFRWPSEKPYLGISEGQESTFWRLISVSEAVSVSSYLYKRTASLITSSVHRAITRSLKGCWKEFLEMTALHF